MHPLRWPRDRCYCVGNAEHRGRIQHTIHQTRDELTLALEVEQDGATADVRLSAVRASLVNWRSLAVMVSGP